MASEFCPSCRELRNMQVSISEKICCDEIVIVRSYHCETCNCFVRSEEIGISGDGMKITGRKREKANQKHR